MMFGSDMCLKFMERRYRYTRVKWKDHRPCVSWKGPWAEGDKEFLSDLPTPTYLPVLTIYIRPSCPTYLFVVLLPV